jgi:peptidoglycan hydrolase-like protein with peptidoglycan-binding domain
MRVLTLLAAAGLPAAALTVGATPALAAVRTCSTSTPVASRPLLRQGDTGSCVKVAQQALVAKGYSVGTSGVDGDFGAATYRATVAFQRDFALAADGVIGPMTWGKLASGPSYDRGRGPNYTSRVVLTFDDCPKSASAFVSVVKAAKAANIGLVLAPTGDCLTGYKKQGMDLAAVARSYGQYVINHSVSHPDLTKISYASVLTQLSAPGVVTNVGRPPYGATNSTVAMAYTAKGMRQWTWTVDTLDWTGKTTAQVVSYVVTYAKAGSTVLMHMQWNGFTPTAVAQMTSGLAGRGLHPCTAYHGTAPVRLPTSLPCAS